MNDSSLSDPSTNLVSTTSYDRVPYPDYVHAQTHPRRLAALGHLFGMQPAPVDRCRVLELGCGQGANLIPIATCYPETECVGIDLSERHIAKGKETVAALELSNLRLRAESILDFPAEAGLFDYIIVHGVYSWVPAEVRDKILLICKQHLAASGIAIVSYNTFPGWHQRRMIRDMMGFHTRTIQEPAKKIEQAKAFLTFMTKAIPETSAYGRSLHEEFRSLAGTDDSYLFHEQLEDINEPQYFHEFADKLSEKGLQYLSEVELSNLQFDRYPQPVAETLRKMELVQREQYLDFLMRRTFRQTLVCHDDVKLDRTSMARQLTELRIACPAATQVATVDVRDGKSVVFQGLGGVQLTMSNPLAKAAFVQLASAWPSSVPFKELEAIARTSVAGDAIVIQDSSHYEQDSNTLADCLTQSFVAGAIELHTLAPSYTTTVSPMPLACPLARFQAENSNRITTRLHQMVTLDPLTCWLIRHLDGKTDRDQLLDVMARFVSDSDVVIQQAGKRVDGDREIRGLLAQKIGPNLTMLGRYGLLIG